MRLQRKKKNLENTFQWSIGLTEKENEQQQAKILNLKETQVSEKNQSKDIYPKSKAPGVIEWKRPRGNFDRNGHMINKASLGPGYYKYTEMLDLKQFRMNKTAAFASESSRNLKPVT